MSKYIISRELCYPHTEADGTIIQMKHITIGVTATQEEGETLEDVERNLEEVFSKQERINENKIPKIRQLNKQLLKFKELVQPLIDQNKFDSIIKQVKSL